MRHDDDFNPIALFCVAGAFFAVAGGVFFLVWGLLKVCGVLP